MKKLLFRILLGFSLGITTLMVAYLGIYYVAGQDAFTSVISRLTNVAVFQNQFLVVGFAGIIMAFAVSLTEKSFFEALPSSFITIVSMISLLLSLVVAMLLINTIGNFDEVMINMLIIISTVLICFYCLANCIRETVDEFIINKKIKEKNS